MCRSRPLWGSLHVFGGLSDSLCSLRAPTPTRSARVPRRGAGAPESEPGSGGGHRRRLYKSVFLSGVCRRLLHPPVVLKPPPCLFFCMKGLSVPQHPWGSPLPAEPDCKQTDTQRWSRRTGSCKGRLLSPVCTSSELLPIPAETLSGPQAHLGVGSRTSEPRAQRDAPEGARQPRGANIGNRWGGETPTSWGPGNRERREEPGPELTLQVLPGAHVLHMVSLDLSPGRVHYGASARHPPPSQLVLPSVLLSIPKPVLGEAEAGGSRVPAQPGFYHSRETRPQHGQGKRGWVAAQHRAGVPPRSPAL